MLRKSLDINTLITAGGPFKQRDDTFIALLVTQLLVFGFENLLALNLETLAISLQILAQCLGLVCTQYVISHHTQNTAVAYLITLSFILFVVWMPSSRFLVYFAFLLSALYSLRHVYSNKRSLIMGCMMGLVAALSLVGSRGFYTTFNMSHRIHLGAVAQDTLYHASIAAMIKNYGVVSTGLHGLIETPYHSFSHALLAGMSVLSGCSVLEVYGVVPILLFSPWLVQAMAEVFSPNDEPHPMFPLAWSMSSLLLLLLPFFFGWWGIWASYFTSESYLVGLTLFLFGYRFLLERDIDLVGVLLIAIIGLFATAAKASVGLILWGLWGVRLLLEPTKKYVLITVATLSPIVAYTAFSPALAAVESGGLKFGFMDFFGYTVGGRHIGLILNSPQIFELPWKTLAIAPIAFLSFLAIHFLATWTAIALMASSSGKHTRTKRLVFWYLIFSTLVGLSIVFMFEIPGGSAYYFSNVSMFIALPFIVSQATSRIVPASTFRYFALVTSACFLFAIPGALEKFHLYRPPKKENALAKQLILLRETTSPNVVLKLNAEMALLSPIERCTAQPFFYPAVSERAWVGIPFVPRHLCKYRNYGYGEYKISEDGELGVEISLNGFETIDAFD